MSENRSGKEPVSAVLVEKEGKFFVYEPGLGIIVSDDDVEGAYRQFVEARRDYLGRLEHAGLALVPEASSRQEGSFSPRRDVRRELGIFVAKTCIVIFVIAVMLSPVFFIVGRAVDRAAGSTGQALGSLGAVSFADASRKVADVARDLQDLPEETKKRLRQDLETIARELTPLVEAWRSSPAPKSQQTPPSSR